nr:MAG TPA: hypothetical protein [Caudoviricetes sp.]
MISLRYSNVITISVSRTFTQSVINFMRIWVFIFIIC